MQRAVLIGVVVSLIVLAACDNDVERFEAPDSASIADIWRDRDSFEGKLIKVVGELHEDGESSFMLRPIETAAQSSQELFIRFKSDVVPDKIELCKNEQVVVTGSISSDERLTIIADYVTPLANHEKWNFDNCHDDGIIE